MKKSVRRSPSAETRWRACEEDFASAAGPKRREALATGARHGKLDAGFFLNEENSWMACLYAKTEFLKIYRNKKHLTDSSARC
jgi:hypothetical protein